MSQYKIAIDTKGSDKGYAVIVKGAAEALCKFENLSVLLVGDEKLIEEEATRLGMPKDRYEILDAPDTVTNYDAPSSVIFGKADSSLVKTLVALSDRDDIRGMISAGNTGALLAGTVKHIHSKERIRPALAALLPSSRGSYTCLVDAGATIDCSAPMLLHFARLGSDFMKRMYAIESPRIGLLSNGSEPTKGNKLVKEAHELLKNEKEINFIGNVEGNGVFTGACDVLVCDGFAGNQVLKVSEGMATRMMTDIVTYAKRTQSADVMDLLGHLMGIYDLSSLGGGIILGTEKPIIKARGSSNEKSIVSVSGMILNMVENKAIFDRELNKI